MVGSDVTLAVTTGEEILLGRDLERLNISRIEAYSNDPKLYNIFYDPNESKGDLRKSLKVF